MRMLSFDMKRKINTLRDILVGKVPDPKSQVEQITIAMVFKFMDDMDKEFLTDDFFGGQRKFFVDTDKVKYSKYSWTNIMSPQIGGQEKADLYREGIEAMQHNPNLPQFFRDVFRNAYIPFRDSETINLFLKEINDFSYDNSEDLGEAFEMLLSIMGSQGDAGQFRTPRHLIDMIVDIVQPTKTDRILDPACGTAGFLISAYKYILEHNKDGEGRIILTPDEKMRLMQKFEGYDISQDMVRLSSVNMYLHHFPDPKIHEYDTLTAQDRWDDQFDVIFANPPFMTPKGGIIPHNRFRVQAKRSEILFIDYIAEHLAPNGRAGIIVPEGIVFQSANAYKELRKYLVDEGLLYAIISLPAGVFNPYSGVKTSILLIDKSFAKQRDDILFVKVNNDGYDLGAQRRPIKENDIPDVLKIVNSFKDDEDVSDSLLVTIVKKETIKDQGYILVGDRYKSVITINSTYPMIELEEVLSYEQPTNYIVESVDYDDSYATPVLTAGQSFVLGFTNEQAGIYSNPLPVIIFDDFTTAIQFVDFPFKVKSSAMKILKANESKANIKYVYHAMKNLSFNSSIHKRYWIAEYSKLQIPLPPLSLQEEIVEEIESYQKIIDGARQIVDNYKPVIKTNSNWSMTKLGDVCDFVRGPFGGSLKKEIFVDNGYLVYEQYHAINNDFSFGRYFITEQKFEEMKRFEVLTNDILISCSGTMGKIAIVPPAHKKGIINQALLKLTPNDKVIPWFVKLYLESSIVQQRYFINQSGAAIQNVISVKELKEIPFPSISIEEQKQITEKLQEEMVIIDQNRRLIEIFEQKIADAINQIWTSDECESPVSSFPATGDSLQYAARNTSNKFIEVVQQHRDGDSDE